MGVSGDDGLTQPDDTTAFGLITWSFGKPAGKVIGASLLGWITAVMVAIIEGSQALLRLLFLPFEIFFGVGLASAQGFLIEPLELLEVGVATVATAITTQLTGLAGFLGLPVAIIEVLIAFLIVGLFLSLGPTSEVIPGIFTDNRVYRFFFTTPEEEEEGS